MNICIVPGKNSSEVNIDKLAKSLQSQHHNISIGQSTIDEKFSGSDSNDLTNLKEFEFPSNKLLENHNADLFLFLDNDWNSVKSVTRILRSLEYHLFEHKRVLLYDSKRWADFFNMLNNTYKDPEQLNILRNVELSDTLEIKTFSLN